MVNKVCFDDDRNANVMLAPLLRNAATKFDEKASKHKEKAEKEEREARAKRYVGKCGRLWHMCRDLGRSVAEPLEAVKRPKAGPKGEAAGTVATAPKEVDAIIRKVYGKIYKGICRDQQATADSYIRNNHQF